MCPCCFNQTLPVRGRFEICRVCFWEDDGQDDSDADVVRGGPNGELSLTQGRENYKTLQASKPYLNVILDVHASNEEVIIDMKPLAHG
jgi:Cysteine-rich CPCC